MGSPMFDLDLNELETEMDSMLPSLDFSSLCCCHLIDSSLEKDRHLDDCELLRLPFDATRVPADDGSDASSTKTNDVASSSESDVNARRRKQHRESMARLRKGWRTSIAALEQQEKELLRILQRMIDVTALPNNGVYSSSPASPLSVLRRSYCELVAEQARLEQENVSLEASRAHHDKYERMLKRELVRVRTFKVSDQ